MSILSDKQKRFTLMVAQLIFYAYSRGYTITFGDAYRDKRVPYGLKKSLHRSRLAVDLNLFDADGNYLRTTEDHRELGEFWEYLGGSWGGRFNDGNHYSLAHEGRK